MSFSIKVNYNFEILLFLNVLTSDEYYVRLNKKAYEIFFSLISNQSRENISAMVEILKRTNIVFPLNILLAQIVGYEDNSIAESFLKKDEIGNIVAAFRQMPYIPIEYLDQVDTILNMAVEIVKDLEKNGFYEYWKQEIKPSIDIICNDIQELITRNEFIDIFSQYKPSLPNSVNISVLYIDCMVQNCLLEAMP